MPEEQAFCVLVRLMFDYKLRDLYKDDFEVLKMKQYQLSRLLEVSARWIRVSAHNWDIGFYLSRQFSVFSYENIDGKQLVCLFSGERPAIVDAFPREGHRNAHVRASVVPNAVYGPLSAVLCLLHARCGSGAGFGHDLPDCLIFTHGNR